MSTYVERRKYIQIAINNDTNSNLILVLFDDYDDDVIIEDQE